MMKGFAEGNAGLIAFFVSLGVAMFTGCAPVGPIPDPPFLQAPLSEPPAPPPKPGTKIKGTIGAGPGLLELTDAAGNKAFAHVDKDKNIEGFVEKENFQPVTATLELNDRSKTTWDWKDGQWHPRSGTSAQAGSGTTAGSTPHRLGLVHRLLDTQLMFLFGQSFIRGVNSTSTGAPPGGAPFLQGSGASNGSQSSYNVMLLHHFDRFMPFLGGMRPFVYFQGSSFTGLDGTGGAGVSAAGTDRAALQRSILHAFGGGFGFSYPLYCPTGVMGGNGCVEAGLFAGAKAVRQQLNATADEAGNIRTATNSFYQVVPSGGAMLSAPFLWKSARFVAMYEAIALNSVGISVNPSANNIYNYRSDGGLIHNVWFGISFNLGTLFCDPA